MACPLWLVGYPDGTLREQRSSGPRRRRLLPRPPWFKERDVLVAARQFDCNHAEVEALVCVAPGKCGSGILSAWNQEERLLWEYLRRPMDAYSVRICNVLQVDPPALVTSTRNKRGQIGRIAVRHNHVFLAGRQIDLSASALVSHAHSSSSVEQRPLADIFSSWGVDGLENNVAPCMWLPYEILHLVLLGHWRHLVLSASWTSATNLVETLNWPPQAWRSSLGRALGASSQTAGSAEVTGEALQTLADRLRQWAPGIIANNSRSTRLELERYVRFLDGAAAGLGAGYNVHPVAQNQERRAGGSRYLAESLIHAVIGSSMLKNRSRLQDIAMHCIKLTVPEQMRSACLEATQRIILNMPSPSAARRAQLSLDLAFMRHWRSMLASRSVHLYLWVDSSPQGGRDWLLSSYAMIEGERLAKCFHMAHLLMKSVDRWHDAYDMQAGPQRTAMMVDIARDRDLAGRFLRESIRVHRQIPIALGSGCTSLESKMGGLLHAMMMETQSTHLLKQVAGSIVCVTPDMGVESLLAGAEGGGVEAYMPTWANPRLELDCDELDDACRVEPAPEDRARQADTHPLRKALLAAGMLHIDDNMTKEMAAALPGWDQWSKGLTHLTLLLGVTHNRERFVELCVKQVPEHAACAHLFASNIHTTIEWRWSSVVLSLRDIQAVKVALRQVWSKERFKGSAGFGEAQGPAAPTGPNDESSFAAKRTFDVDVVTRTMESSEWWAYAAMVLELHEVARALSGWAEGCRCHEWLRSTNGRCSDAALALDALHRECAELQQAGGERGEVCDGSRFNCPLRGMRAVELAAGP